MPESYLLQNQKNRFLADEFFMLSWGAASEHNKIWTVIKEKKKQKEFKLKIKEELEKILLQYSCTEIDKKAHKENINRLQDFAKCSGQEIDFGKCQKLLNMMCKYYWCVGWISNPSDMPIDSMNLSELSQDKYNKVKNQLGCKGKINWTQDIKDDKDYEFIMEALRGFAEEQGFDSVAVWELCNWRRKVNKL